MKKETALDGEYTVMVYRGRGVFGGWAYDVNRDGKFIGGGGNYPTRRAAEKQADKLIAKQAPEEK